jgi:putative transposase
MQQDVWLAERRLDILINAVSTRRYEQVRPAIAETVSVSKSQVLREPIEAGERLPKELAEWDFSGLDILAVWIDGIPLGSYHVICAVGVYAQGHKDTSWVCVRASWRTPPSPWRGCRTSLARGPAPQQRRFVIDGSKALRAAIDAVEDRITPVQRCRNPKVRTVVGPRAADQHEPAEAMLEAAFKLDAQGRGWSRSSNTQQRGWSGTIPTRRRRFEKDLKRC